MSSLRRRALVATAALLGAGASIAFAPGAEAHGCAKVTVWVSGSPSSVGSCHPAPGDPGDLCAPFGATPAGTGVSGIACVPTSI